MMNKEKILLDFSVFILSDVEELCSCITDFFGQANRQDYPFDFNLFNYEEYLRKEIDVQEIIENNDLNANSSDIDHPIPI